MIEKFAEKYMLFTTDLIFLFGLFFLSVAVITIIGCKLGNFDHSRLEYPKLGIVSTQKKNAQILSLFLTIVGIILISIN